MGVWEDFRYLMELYNIIVRRYRADFISSQKRFFCSCDGSRYRITVEFDNCNVEAMKLVDKGLCNVMPQVKLVFTGGVVRHCVNVDISLTLAQLVLFKFGNGDVFIRFSDVRRRYGGDEFHVWWRAGRYEGLVSFNHDPSEDEVVEYVVKDFENKIEWSMYYGVVNIDDVVRVAIKIVRALGDYLSRRIVLYELFP